MSLFIIIPLIAFFLAIAALVIGGFVILEKSREDIRKAVISAPKFIIKPSYGLGYEICEKELWPIPGGIAPLMNYRSLLGHYETKEEAEKQLAHYIGKD